LTAPESPAAIPISADSHPGSAVRGARPPPGLPPAEGGLDIPWLRSDPNCRTRFVLRFANPAVRTVSPTRRPGALCAAP